jgi:small conductance mechanosensitive channel
MKQVVGALALDGWLLAPPNGAPFGFGPTAWVWIERGMKVGITVFVAVILLNLVRPLERMVLRRAAKHGSPASERKSATITLVEQQRRAETLTRVTGSVARAIIWGMTVVIVLGNVGVDIQPLIAGAGVAGVAIGFGAQSIVKDFFAGFFILLEGQFDVGDTVTAAGVTGAVERMTMRITVLRDVTGAVHFIPNSAITLVANKTEGWGRTAVDVVFGPSVTETQARGTLDAAASAATDKVKNERVLLEQIAVEGPVEFGPTGITWRLSGKVRPDRAMEVRRAMISALANELRGRGFAPDGTSLVVKATPTPSAAPPPGP